ncbi:hypothetical protein CAPI_01580 [Corynebacterium capitovis DSM 44611]|uniref:recombinase family protein n=1 Tax=Corynebacterium capitovis TaxID=131081 RepID=UPI00036ADF5A|nr:recombinase family protein [Corynebacterium capitovis]WKD56890.1 hypothetical protein CAPI_01580 [Corynebacterium capitovis DSM 44611]
MPFRAAIYARISLDRKEEAGVQRQVHLASKQAEADEACVVAEYVDNNVSAFSGEFRPEYDKLLKSVQAGELDIIYVYALDRLTRRTKDTLALFELCEKHGVKIKANRGYGIDPQDPASRLTIVILGLIAEQESIDRAARIRAAYEDRARTGRPKTGGFRMFGYEVDGVTIREDEAQAILDAAKMIISGKALREACREIFHPRGLETTRGNPMNAYTLRDILLNPRVRGISTFQPTNPETGTRLKRDRQVIGPGSWPAIIDSATGEKLDAVLNDPARRKNHAGTAPTKFLASVLTCTCGDPMYSRSRQWGGKSKKFYSCKRSKTGAQHVSIGDEVDDLVQKVILARMAKPDAVEVVRQALAPEDEDLSEKMKDLFTERTALLARREEVEEQVASGDVDVTVFARVEAKIADKLASIDSQLNTMTSSMGVDPLTTEITDGVDFGEWWEGASVEDKRRLTKLLMEIHILPGKLGAKKFDPTRVKITWKS